MCTALPFEPRVFLTNTHKQAWHPGCSLGRRRVGNDPARRPGVPLGQPISPSQPALWVQGASSDLPVLPLSRERPVSGQGAILRRQPLPRERPVSGQGAILRRQPLPRERPVSGQGAILRRQGAILRRQPPPRERPVRSQEGIVAAIATTLSWALLRRQAQLRLPLSSSGALLRRPHTQEAACLTTNILAKRETRPPRPANCGASHWHPRCSIWRQHAAPAFRWSNRLAFSTCPMGAGSVFGPPCLTLYPQTHAPRAKHVKASPHS